MISQCLRSTSTFQHLHLQRVQKKKKKKKKKKRRFPRGKSSILKWLLQTKIIQHCSYINISEITLFYFNHLDTYFKSGKRISTFKEKEN